MSYTPNPETWESESQEEPQRLISMEGPPSAGAPGGPAECGGARVPASSRHCCAGGGCPGPSGGQGLSPRCVLSHSLAALDRESGPETGRTGLARAWITRLCVRFQHGRRATGLLHLEGAESLVRLELGPLFGVVCARRTQSQGTQILWLA